MKPAIRQVEVGVERPYSVRIGPGVAGEAARRCEGWHRSFVLTDESIARLHADRVSALPRSTLHVVPPGEASKSFAQLELVLDAMVAAGCDRSSGLIAFGGGVVGDLGGLAAALFHRGIPYAQMPTTLLAMVDSSVGGKTAVNLRGGKNLAGAFCQPVEVLADTELLATLPDEEYRSGLGEVLKTALLSRPLFDVLEELAGALSSRDPDALAQVVEWCVSAKARIVEADPHERGSRRLLNLGHTFAHAIERVAGYGRVPHGVAVAVGIDLVLRAARADDEEQAPDLGARCASLARKLGLPTTLAELARAYRIALGPDELIAAMQHDKKSRGGQVLFVVPSEPGRVRWDVELAPESVRAALESSVASC